MKTELLDLRQIVRGEIASISTNDYNKDQIKHYYVLIYEEDNGDLSPIKIRTKKPNHSFKGKYVEFDCKVLHIKDKLFRQSISEKIIEEEKN